MNEIIRIQEQFGDYLLNFIRGRVASPEDVQDIYQDILYKVITKSEQLTKAQSLKSWLFTIARNQIIDHYRLRKNKVSLDYIADTPFMSDVKTDAYDKMEGCLNGFIKVLPDDYSKAIQLSEIEGKSQKEVAEFLGVNYVTLRSKVQRGRDRLRKLINDACAVEQDGTGRVINCSPNPENSACNAASANRCGVS